jgi:hypothetical protein
MSDRETNRQRPSDADAAVERDLEEQLLAAYERLSFPWLRPDTEPAPATPQPIDAEEAAAREFERQYFPQLRDDA